MCLWPHERRSPCARVGRHGKLAGIRESGDDSSRSPARRSSRTRPTRATRRRHRAAIHPGPVEHALAAVPPPRPSPLDPPSWAPPELPRCARSRVRNPQGGRTLWLRGRSERRGRRRPLRLGGTARDHGPRSRPFPHQPLPPPRGPAACNSTRVQVDGPGWRGAGITSRPTARSVDTRLGARQGASALPLTLSDATAISATASARPSRGPPPATRLAPSAVELRSPRASGGPLRQVMRGFAAHPQPTPPRPPETAAQLALRLYWST